MRPALRKTGHRRPQKKRCDLLCTAQEAKKLPNPTHLHRRGVIFAHRDLDNVLEAKKAGRPFGVLSGLMPSGQIHLGHKMVIDQAKWFQDLGGDVTITVADCCEAQMLS